MDGHSSVPLIARGLARLLAQTLCGTLPNVLADLMEHGLALGKDFAVSLPLFCPYGGIGPSSSGLGPPGFSPLGVTARTSVLANGGCWPLPFYLCLRKESVRTFLCLTTATVWITSLIIIRCQ
jgi:hypothetical protein